LSHACFLLKSKCFQAYIDPLSLDQVFSPEISFASAAQLTLDSKYKLQEDRKKKQENQMLRAFAILTGISWAMGPRIPLPIRQTIESQIQQDLQKRTRHCKCQIGLGQIHFGDLRVLDSNKKELVYELKFDERSPQGVSHFRLKKKLVFNSSWQIIRIAPLDQDIRFENGSEVVL
jgi:hypothetical protein